MKLGVVLSGGGSKGAYEIGVWKALRKLNVKYTEIIFKIIKDTIFRKHN